MGAMVYSLLRVMQDFYQNQPYDRVKPVTKPMKPGSRGVEARLTGFHSFLREMLGLLKGCIGCAFRGLYRVCTKGLYRP